MKCDRCENEATVHEVLISAGKRVERHLCEACARQAGVVVTAPGSLKELLSQHGGLITGPAAATTPTADHCPACGMTFAHFRKEEKLGCGECYTTFEKQLGGLIERIHDGATQHMGKAPKRQLGCGGDHEAKERSPVVVVSPAELQRRVTTLQKQLEEAIVLEQYERAAHLRDELARLQKIQPGPIDTKSDGGGPA